MPINDKLQTANLGVMITVLLLIFSFFIFALSIHDKSGLHEKEALENMTKESLMTEKQTNKSGISIQDFSEKMNQQQVLDYWKQVLPDNVNKEMYHIRFETSQNFDICGWKIDPSKREVTFYIFHVRDQNVINNLQGERIENWTITIIHDTVFEKEYDTIIADLKQLKKKPELRILSSNIDMDPWVIPPEKRIVIWVEEQTPENQKLDKSYISGWIISVIIDSGIKSMNLSSG